MPWEVAPRWGSSTGLGKKALGLNGTDHVLGQYSDLNLPLGLELATRAR